MSDHIFATYMGMSINPAAWPAKGEKVIFLNKNGYEYEREAANAIFAEGRELTVRAVYVGRSDSRYVFEELPDREFNTVMFGRKDQKEQRITPPDSIFKDVNVPAVKAVRQNLSCGLAEALNMLKIDACRMTIVNLEEEKEIDPRLAQVLRYMLERIRP